MSYNTNPSDFPSHGYVVLERLLSSGQADELYAAFDISRSADRPRPYQAPRPGAFRRTSGRSRGTSGSLTS